MNLPFLNRKTPEKLFISLVISESTVAASLWSASAKGQEILQVSEPVAWDEEAESSLADSSDAAMETLGTQVNFVKEVLLGLPESWATGQTIVADKKSLLQRLTKDLNLKSVGFVITSEAIAARFREKEKTGLNALLIFVSSKTVQLMPLVHGQAQETVKVGRSDSLIKDVLEGCARGNFTSLPGRILLASQDLTEVQLTGAQQEMEATEWKDKLFLHHPRVDLVPPQMILEAVSLAGGKEVAAALGILKTKTETRIDEEEEADEKDDKSDFGFKPVVPEQLPHSGERVDLGEIETPLPSRNVKLPIIVAFVVLLLLTAGLMGSYFGLKYFSKVLVDVVIKTQPVSFNSTLTIDANASETNAEAGILKATLRTKEVSGTADAIATGTKVIGDKAKGMVTIYNRTVVGDKTFPAGTILKLDDKVQFSLDANVTVPVGTIDNQYVGKATVAVTAVNIGAESNIANAIELTVGGFDKASFVATTNGAFTGGSSRNVQVVSDADQKKLADTLLAQLKQQALGSFTTEVGADEHVALSQNVSVTKKQFSDDIGKEVKSFTLSMSVSANAIVYTNADIASYASLKLASQIPPGATLQSDKTVVEIKDQKNVSDSKIIVNATISSEIVPAFEVGQITKVLAGKTIMDAKAFLDASQSVASYKIIFTPSFADKILTSMPQAEHIIIKTTVE